MEIIFENVNGSGIVYLDCLKAICGNTDGKSMADLGCNHAPYTCQLGFEKRTYIDILPRTLDEAKEQQYFVHDDALNWLINQKENVDVSISSDHIEHLTKDKGFELLLLMEAKSSKQIIFTPLGNYMVNEQDTNPENHHSGWMPEYFAGYAKIIFPKYHPTLNVGAFFCDKM